MDQLKRTVLFADSSASRLSSYSFFSSSHLHPHNFERKKRRLAFDSSLFVTVRLCEGDSLIRRHAYEPAIDQRFFGRNQATLYPLVMLVADR